MFPGKFFKKYCVILFNFLRIKKIMLRKQNNFPFLFSFLGHLLEGYQNFANKCWISKKTCTHITEEKLIKIKWLFKS